MLTIPQSEMDAILNNKIRRRVLLWPIEESALSTTARHPTTGQTLSTQARGGTATRPCPFREGGRYILRSQRHDRSWPDSLREARARESTVGRARAILWLIDQYGERRLRVTVRTIEANESHWKVAFSLDAKAEIRDLLDDSPLLLRRGGGYSAWDEIDAGELMTPFEKDLEKARRDAREGYVGPMRNQVNDLSMRAGALKEALVSMKQRNRLRRIEHDLKKLSEELVDSIAPVASDLEAHTDASRRSRDTAAA